MCMQGAEAKSGDVVVARVHYMRDDALSIHLSIYIAGQFTYICIILLVLFFFAQAGNQLITTRYQSCVSYFYRLL